MLGKTTTYGYDNLNRLITETLPDPDGAGALDAPVATYAYDAVGNAEFEIFELVPELRYLVAWLYYRYVTSDSG